MTSAGNAAWSRKAYEVAWRLSILALPWQTRWFWDARLAGWPWEQGRISFYLSWLPVIATIVLASWRPKRPIPLILRRNLFWLIVALGACTVIASPLSVTAAIQWWIQTSILLFFIITLWRTEVDATKAMWWSVISLVPQACLAVAQTAGQTVWASKWLGIAGQNPVDLGVSVVQTAGIRFLRAYGSFPHPNILGGWMATGLITTAWLLIGPSIGRKSRPYFWTIEGLFAFVLFYSFSRSAWLAAAVGLVIYVLMSFRAQSRNLDRSLKPDPSTPSSDSFAQDDKTKKQEPRGKRLLAVFLPVILFGLLVVLNHNLVFTRLTASDRLEQKSVISRIQTLQDGVIAYQALPLFGTGPNAELPVLAQIRNLTTAPAPLEPPHMVWLLILVDFGTVGTLLIAGFALFLLRQVLDAWPHLDRHGRTLLVALVSSQLVLCSLDHYVWSYWSGQALGLMTIFFMVQAFSEKKASSLTA